MGFLTDKEIEGRLDSPGNLVNRLEVHKIVRGKPVGTPQIPIEIKKTIAILGNEGETGKSLAEAFDINISGSNEIIRGDRLDSNKELAPVIASVKARIKDNRESAEAQAIETLLASLQVLPKEMMTGSMKKAKGLSSIAKDMSMIANQMGGKDTGDGKPSVHVHLYAPRQKAVNEYETIDV